MVPTRLLRNELTIAVKSDAVKMNPRFRDCTPGKSYPGEFILPTDVCADGVPSHGLLAVSFVDDVGDVVVFESAYDLESVSIQRVGVFLTWQRFLSSIPLN